MPPVADRGLLAVAANVVVAYAAHNRFPPGELPDVVRTVHQALVALKAAKAVEPPAPREPASPDAIRRSIRPDALVSFVDGRFYKTLRRHLATHGLSPAAYRERYGLPRDYPMVAPEYRALRSRIAKGMGLGVPPRPV